MRKGVVIAIVVFIILIIAFSCGDDYEYCDHYVPYDEWEIEEEADCVNNGYKVGECEYCGEEVEETIYATGHTVYSWTTIKQATCTVDGYKGGECTVCEEYVEKTIYASHSYGDWTLEREATCTQAGTKYRLCSVCYDKYYESISMLSHNYGDWVIEKEPSCEQDGERWQECSLCHGVVREVISSTGHSYEHGVCTGCGDFKLSEGLSFALNSTGDGYVLVGIGSFSGADIIIPSEHEGKPITEIGANAFKGNATITSVTIPDSVTIINERAFEECTLLESITLGSGVTTILDYAFSGCNAMKSVSLGNKLTEIRTGAFYNCQLLEGVELPSTLSLIYPYAFSGCSSLKEIIIPEGVSAIGEHCFAYSIALESVTIPKSLQDIGYNAFMGCSAINRVDISSIGAWCTILFGGIESNPVYYAGKLYVDGNPLVSLVIPNGTERINNYVFANCLSITDVLLPASLTSIGSDAFLGCTGLQKVNVTSIDSWNNISFGNDDANPMTYAGKLTIDGATLSGSIVIADGITEIPAGTFKNSAITSVSIPSSVTKIGADAFLGCTQLSELIIADLDTWCTMTFGSKSANPLSFVHNLYEGSTLVTEIIIPASVGEVGEYLFAGCTSIERVVISSGITAIAQGAFSGCTSLREVIIPASLTSIGNDAFFDCNSLVSVDVEDFDAWCAVAFGNDASNPLRYADKILINGSELAGDIEIPYGTTEIPYGLFKGSSVTSIIIPDTVTKINAYAFSDCTLLQGIELGSGITEIGEGAFYNCTALTTLQIKDIGGWCQIDFANEASNPVRITNSIYMNGLLVLALEIPNGITEIAEGAFYGCNHITTIVIPETVTTIGKDAFYGCDSVTGISAPTFAFSSISRNELVDAIITGGDTILNSTFSGCTKLENVQIQCSIKEIAENAFLGCSSLTGLILPSSLEVIGGGAFNGCEALASISLPYGLKTIGRGAFNDCKLLKQIDMPDTVTSIAEAAFSGCSGLESITIPFVGESAKALDATYQYPFGYIFGSSSYEGSYSVVQEYHASSTSTRVSLTSYIPSSLKYVALTGGSVPSGAFQNCSSITSLSISDNIIGVGADSFEGCSGIEYTTYEGVKYLGSASNQYLIIVGVESNTMTSCNIAGGARFSCRDAFSGCSSLDAVGISSIADWCAITFDGYTSNPLYFAGNLYVGGSLVASLTIPNGVTEIKDYAFTYATIQSLSIPGSVTRIGSSAFAHCESLSSVSMADGVTELANDAFAYCAITGINLPSTLATIGNSAFFGCSQLSSITIPNSVKTIGEMAFQNCSQLSSVKLGSGLTAIGERAFAYTAISQIIIPKRVSSIGENAFSCSKIFCEASYQPNGWLSRWNSNTGTIYWYSDDGGPLTTKDYWCYDRSGNIYIWD